MPLILKFASWTAWLLGHVSHVCSLYQDCASMGSWVLEFKPSSARRLVGFGQLTCIRGIRNLLQGTVMLSSSGWSRQQPV